MIKMSKCKYIYLIVGKSGVGKTSVINELCQRYGLSEVISYTTRHRRLKEGNTHIFVDKQAFESIKDNLVAFTEFDGNLYGVDAQAIEDNDLYSIDIKGINFFKSHYTGNKPFKIILIDAPEDVCHMRMITRGDSHIAIAKRLANDKIAFKDVEKIADYIVENDYFNSCVKSIYDYICENERGNKV